MKDLAKKLYGNHVVRYLFFGGCTTLVNLISFFTLRHTLLAGGGGQRAAANVISIILAILFAYVVNSKYVFQNRCETLRDHLKPFLKFISARLFSMVVEVGGLELLVTLLRGKEVAAKLLTQILVLILNYLFSRYFVFTSGKQ